MTVKVDIQCILYGIASRYAFEALEIAKRSNITIVACIDNLGNNNYGSLPNVLQVADIKTDILDVPVTIPLITPGYRKLLENEIKKLGFSRFATFIDKTSIIALSSSWQEGIHINANSVIGANSQFGKQVLVNRSVSIGHDAIVEDYVSFGPGCVVCGSCQIKVGSFIGAGSTIIPILCVSCSGRKDPSFESRSRVLDLKGDLQPDMGSLTLSSLNFTRNVSINAPDTVIRLVEKMQDNGIKPELEIFDLGMVNYAHYMINKGYLESPYYFNIILGNIASAQASLLQLGAIVNELPEDSIWSVGGIGNAQLSANIMSIAQGGGVRIGLEDNIWFDEQKKQLATNKLMLERIASIIKLLGKEIMTPSELRYHLKLIK